MVCGHIHHPEIADQRGIRYVNTGDWVESCSAVAETFDGEFVLITWTEVVSERNVAALKTERAAA